jgi:CDP-glucose 4,6-dehydratase
MPFDGTYDDTPVLVTGHTGFKGAWMAAWLLELGARVTGLALPPEGEPNLFETLGLADRLDHRLGDIRDADLMNRLVAELRPAVIFHLAAQSLVRRSYAEPAETFATNIQGTVNLLEAVRRAGCPATIVVVTSDKCYENRGEDLDPSSPGHAEGDPLGGNDPYSASKAGAELVVAAYRRSFFDPARFGEHGVALASARAGNVIGGGDWAVDRIVPDIMRALSRKEIVQVRNPGAIRPWQHVLDALSGYLWLAARLAGGAGDLAEAWNFGPLDEKSLTVGELVNKVLARWGEGSWASDRDPAAPRETAMLRLSCAKAVEHLDWRPVWGVEVAVEKTVDWHRRLADEAAMDTVSADQIAEHTRQAGGLGRPWAVRP